jgi:hypothetical protein
MVARTTDPEQEHNDECGLVRHQRLRQRSRMNLCSSQYGANRMRITEPARPR